MVRSYHPDQFTENKAEANHRMAALNAAFDLTSAWSPEDARAYATDRAKRRAAQDVTSKNEARQTKAKERAADLRKREAAARAVAERAARRRAAEADRQDTAKRAARATLPKQGNPIPITARKTFTDAIRELAPRRPSRDFGLV